MSLIHVWFCVRQSISPLQDSILLSQFLLTFWVKFLSRNISYEMKLLFLLAAIQINVNPKGHQT